MNSLRDQVFCFARAISLMLLFTGQASAFSWQDLWSTPDQQAAVHMQKGEFEKAQSLFQDPSWHASAAYRAGNYAQSAQEFRSLSNEQGYYNSGNALAHSGKLQEAIKAYDKALAINPANKDAKFNRELVAALLKKEQEKQKQNKQSSDQKQQNQQNNQQQQSGNSGKDKQDKQDNQDKQRDQNPQNNQNGKGEPQQYSSPKDQNKSDQEKQQQKPSSEEKKDATGKQDKADKSPNDSTQQAAKPQSAKDKEKQQAKEQWLRLIPDDPGGLLREKFLRDYIRRQNGANQ